MEHPPPAQLATPPALEQRAPQRPQWFTSVITEVSQPSEERPLQSLRALGHISVEMPQAPPVHTAVAPAGGAGQRRPQAPQLATSPTAVLTSQPSASRALQSAKPGLQAPIAQRAPAQLVEALGALHRLPQAPQFIGSVLSETHRPPQSARSGPMHPAAQASPWQASGRSSPESSAASCGALTSMAASGGVPASIATSTAASIATSGTAPRSEGGASGGEKEHPAQSASASKRHP